MRYRVNGPLRIFDYAVKAKAYPQWQRQAAEDPSWAEMQPFFGIVKNGSDFHINSTFGREIIRSL